jgi:hypothetical protein
MNADAGKSGSRCTTSWPSERSTSTVRSKAARTSGAIRASWPGASFVEHAIRRRPGGVLVAARKPSAGASSAVASRNSAASATRRASGLLATCPATRRRAGHRDAVALGLDADESAPRARDADRAGAVGPTRPHRPVAVAAAELPLDPPGVWSRFHGLRVTPNVSVSVNGHSINSARVLPMTIAPALVLAHDLGVVAYRAAAGRPCPSTTLPKRHRRRRP